MRYLVLTYYRKANGQIDEAMTVTKNLKLRDIQTANVILDFKDQKVVRCQINGEAGIKDWDSVVSYYYPLYTHIIERLFNENGHDLSITAPAQPVDQ